MTQEQMAEKIGCSVCFLSLVERGVDAPSVASLPEYAQALRAEVRDLFTFQKNHN